MKLHKHVSHHVIDSELIPLVVVIGSLSLMFPVTNVLCNYVWRKSAEFLTCFSFCGIGLAPQKQTILVIILSTNLVNLNAWTFQNS